MVYKLPNIISLLFVFMYTCLITMSCGNKELSKMVQNQPLTETDIEIQKLQANPQIIDLHAHLFMNESLTWLFNGTFFDENLKPKNYSVRIANEINAKTLNESGIRIMVVALYACNTVFTWDKRSAVRRQIRLAHKFVSENKDWILATDPYQAKIAYKNGKRLLLLSIEGAADIVDTEESIDEFYDLGVRIITFAHLMDNNLGGAALYGGFANYRNPMALLFNSEVRKNDGRKIRVNTKRLTKYGRKIAKKIIEKGIWIDLTHSSDKLQDDLIPLLNRAGHPLLYTHTAMRKYNGNERAISLEQLNRVAQTGGIVGVLPVPDILRNTPVSKSEEGGINAYVYQYNKIADIIGSHATVVGSDFNGVLPHLKPTKGVGTSIQHQGLWNIGQEKELWVAMKKLGAKLPNPEEAAFHFLDAWEKVYSVPSKK